LYKINGFGFGTGRLTTLKVNFYFGFGPKTFWGWPYKIIKFGALRIINFTARRKLDPAADCAGITCFSKVPSAKLARKAIEENPSSGMGC
jgi:hypothetical protein